MQIKRNWIYYILGIVITIILFGWRKDYFLFLLIGSGLGLLLHTWVKDIYDNTINAFFTSELTKRNMRQKDLELELEKLKKGD
jgi:hypothetical protein